MKRVLPFILAAVMLLSLAACSETPLPETTVPTVPTANTKPVEAPAPTDPLSVLRGEMKPPVMAVAYFGFPQLSKDFEIMDYLLDEYPQWMSEHDFIANMPQERIVRTCGYDAWANLLCIVPRDPKASVCVRVMQHLDVEPYTKETVAYSSNSGEPILLLADVSEQMEVTVEVVGSDGRGIIWMPYWENIMNIPKTDPYYGSYVMYFTPDSEKTAYENALRYGWVIPDESFYTNHLWESSSLYYRLELFYNPGELYDGSAYIYESDWSGDDSSYTITYQGYWSYFQGMLQLKLTGLAGEVFEASLPVLTDPDNLGWLGIYCTDDGVGLPQFDDYMTYDEMEPIGSDAISTFDYALSQGWIVPTPEEIVNTEWVSDCRYAMDLLDDGVPGDNGGEVTVYDVSETGSYSESYTGTWKLEDGMLHLLLIPKNGDGVFVDDSFPILIKDEQLWIGRNEYGNGLPYFYSDMLADILGQSMG